jgi:two-component system cell cycle sensor histidine kinase/response regulator CckA
MYVKNDALRKPRVLCVDDNAPLLQTLRLGLTQHGFDVVTATDGVDAFKQFQAHHGDFACVLTDHDMIGGTGSQLSEILRKAGYQGRIVIMSGGLTEGDLGLYQGHAISGFFRKPFNLSALLAILSL